MIEAFIWIVIGLFIGFYTGMWIGYRAGKEARYYYKSDKDEHEDLTK